MDDDRSIDFPPPSIRSTAAVLVLVLVLVLVVPPALTRTLTIILANTRRQQRSGRSCTRARARRCASSLTPRCPTSTGPSFWRTRRRLARWRRSSDRSTRRCLRSRWRRASSRGRTARGTSSTSPRISFCPWS
eukprot:30493-Pelagococcus_subviridis.AAC.7